MSDSDKINKLLEHLRLSSYSFSKAIGYSNPSGVYHIIKGRYKISSGFADAVIKTFPQVNYRWLKGDDENMLVLPENNEVSLKKLNSDLELIKSSLVSLHDKLNQLIG